MEYTQHLADVRARQERVRPADTPREKLGRLMAGVTE